LKPWLKCVQEEKAKKLLAEIHEGIYRRHQGAKTLAKRVLRACYYWPTVHHDATSLVRKCEKCQLNSRLTHVPPAEMVTIAGAWSFDLWGINILGPFPMATRQRKFIVVAVEYFTKWVEAEALASITSQAIEKFIWKNIICRFGLPHAIISNNGTQFTSRQTISFFSGLGIHNNFTSVSHPASNRLVEMINRMIINGLRKKVQEKQKDWPDMLEEILWAYLFTPERSKEEIQEKKPRSNPMS
jgi:Integrase zinc binding domain/Integrase core domain